MSHSRLNCVEQYRQGRRPRALTGRHYPRLRRPTTCAEPRLTDHHLSKLTRVGTKNCCPGTLPQQNTRLRARIPHVPFAPPATAVQSFAVPTWTGFGLGTGSKSGGCAGVVVPFPSSP